MYVWLTFISHFFYSFIFPFQSYYSNVGFFRFSLSLYLQNNGWQEMKLLVNVTERNVCFNCVAPRLKWSMYQRNGERQTEKFNAHLLKWVERKCRANLRRHNFCRLYICIVYMCTCTCMGYSLHLFSITIHYLAFSLLYAQCSFLLH